MKYLYCILPSGNAPEFPRLDDEVRRSGVVAHYAKAMMGRVYRVAEDEMIKLPKDKKGHYLGGPDSGHSMYPLTSTTLRDVAGKSPKWVRV